MIKTIAKRIGLALGALTYLSLAPVVAAAGYNAEGENAGQIVFAMWWLAAMFGSFGSFLAVWAVLPRASFR